jgi:hypothetical protein
LWSLAWITTELLQVLVDGTGALRSADPMIPTVDAIER